MAGEIAVLEGYRMPRHRRRKGMKLAQAARACKGKKKGAFRACLKKKMRKHRRR